MFAGYSLVGWVIAIVVFMLVLLVVLWGLPLLAGMIGLAIPRIIVVLLALLLALLAAFGGVRSYSSRSGV